MNDTRGFGAFLCRLRGLSLVTRFNFHYVTRGENVAEHSFWVAIYAMIITDIENTLVSNNKIEIGSVLQHALCHDWEESVTGDLPSLIKKTIPKHWNRVANAGFRTLVSDLPMDSKILYGRMWNGEHGTQDDHIRNIVHAADLFDRLMYGRDEQIRGNQAFDRIIKETIKQLRKLSLKSVYTILSELGYHEEEGVDLPEITTHL